MELLWKILVVIVMIPAAVIALWFVVILPLLVAAGILRHVRARRRYNFSRSTSGRSDGRAGVDGAAAIEDVALDQGAERRLPWLS
jgi:hypothetical protein